MPSNALLTLSRLPARAAAHASRTARRGTARIAAAALALLAAGLGARVPARAGAPEHTFVMNAPSFSPGGVSFGFSDAVDPVTGELSASSVDYSLPGKAGLDVTFTRSYSSKGYALRSNLTASPLVDTPLGLSWTLMAAPELFHDFPKTDPQDIMIRLPGGAFVQMYPLAVEGSAGDNVFWSTSHWILIYNGWSSPSQATLYSPTGLAYEYDFVNVYRTEDWIFGSPLTTVQVHLPVSAWDLQGNTLCFRYDDPRTYKTRLREVEDNFGRLTRLTWDVNTAQPFKAPRLQRIDGPGRSVVYDVQSSGAWGTNSDVFGKLVSVNTGDFAVGFRYNEPARTPASCTGVTGGCPWLLTGIDLPTRATVTLTYQDREVVTRLDPSTGWETFWTVVCTKREVDGPFMPTGRRTTTWDYSAPAQDRTVMLDPGGNKTVTIYVPYLAVDPSDPLGSAPIGEVREVLHYDGTARLLETDQYDSEYPLVGLIPADPESDLLYRGLLHRRDLKETRTYSGLATPATLLQKTTVINRDAYGNVLETRTEALDAAARTTTYEYKNCDTLINTNPAANCDGTRSYPFVVHFVHGAVTASEISGGSSSLRIETPINDLGQVFESRLIDRAPGGGDRTQRTEFTFWPNDGRIKTATRYDGTAAIDTTTYVYDDPLTETRVTVTDTLDVSEGTEQLVITRPDGLVSSTTDRNDGVTRYAYTAGGILARVTHPRPGSADTVIDTSAMWAPPPSTPPRARVTREVGATVVASTEHEYDSVLEPVRTRTSAGGATISTLSDRDALGRAIRVSLPTYLNPPSAAGAEGYVETDLDALERPMAIRRIGAGLPTQTTTISYSGPGVTESWDPKSRRSKLQADGFGRLIAITPPGTATTTYAYDGLDHLTTASQPGVATRRFTYSPGGLLDSEEHPESGLTTYAYDRLGRRTGQTQGGLTTTMGYDSRSRLTLVDHPDAGRTDTEYFYDNTGPASLRTCTDNCYDRLTAFRDETGDTRFTAFDDHGLALSRAVALRDPVTSALDHSYTVGYAYDALDQLATITYPSGRVVAVGRDSAGRPLRIDHHVGADPIAALIAAADPATYDASGSSERLPFTTGALQVAAYDAKDRPATLNVSGPGGEVLDLDYDQYDLADNLEKLLVARNGAGATTESFRYDDLDRLTHAGLPDGSVDYQVDGAGNRFGVGSTLPAIPSYTLTPVPGTNRFAQFGYDARGNVVDDRVHRYTYTSDNRLRTVDGGESRCFYDGSGNRVRVDLATGDTYLHAYEAGRRTTTWKLTSAASAPSPSAPPAASSDLAVLHDDAAGTVRARTDESGAAIEVPSLGPFGEDREPRDIAPQGTLAFVGKPRDAISGLEDFGARDYSGRYGRFSTVDPAAMVAKDLLNPQRLNRYSYGLNNPHRFVDPNGEHPVAIGLLVIFLLLDDAAPLNEPEVHSGPATWHSGDMVGKGLLSVPIGAGINKVVGLTAGRWLAGRAASRVLATEEAAALATARVAANQRLAGYFASKAAQQETIGALRFLRAVQDSAARNVGQFMGRSNAAAQSAAWLKNASPVLAGQIEERIAREGLTPAVRAALDSYQREWMMHVQAVASERTWREAAATAAREAAATTWEQRWIGPAPGGGR